MGAAMIARLTGTLAEVASDHAIVDVQGVGYLVLASGKTLDSLGGVGASVTLLTQMQVREDGWTLFAFGSTGEREAFRALTDIQGVGGKVALAILSILGPEELARAPASGDKALVARANGVGPKLAQRIVNELGTKLGTPALVGASGTAPPARGAAQDALSALANLGFKPAEASAAVAKAAEELGEGASLDALVRLALKKAAR
jgi:Holliday junction DNA helicase RuvA